MFKKKAKQEEPVKEINEEELEEEEIITKTVPNPQTAVAIVRDAIRDNVLCICNISKQGRQDIATCMSYLYDYITEPVEVRLSEKLQKQIDESTLGNYTKSYEDNGYEISLTIKKKAKK